MYSLSSIKAVEKAAGRWERKSVRKESGLGIGIDVMSLRGLAARRASFLKSQSMTEEEKQELLERRQRSALAVRKAIKKAQEAEHDRPLRRLGIKFLVVLRLHIAKKEGEVDRRLMVVMDDKLKFDSLPEFVSKVVPDSILHRGQKLIFMHVDRIGRLTSIPDRASWGRWLEANWMRHPPELHIFDSSSLAETHAQLTADLHILFARYDEDCSGGLSVAEMKDMMLELELDQLCGAQRADIAAYVDEAFAEADHNNNGIVDFEEFTSYYNGLQDFIKGRLNAEGSHAHMLVKFAEEYSEARSHEVPIGELVARGGRLELDAHDHDYGIVVEIGESCVTPKNAKKYVRASTVIQQQIDYFTDPADRAGDPFSPTVAIDFQDEDHHEIIASGVGVLAAPYTVTMPHCFATEQFDHNGEIRPLEKDDIVLMYTTWDAGEWHEVQPESFELLPSVPMNRYGCTMPRIRVTMHDGGLISCFCRKDRKPVQRVQVLAFLPPRLNPLETSTLRFFACPLLPNQIEMLSVDEYHERGATVRVGSSKVLNIRSGTEIDLTLGSISGVDHAAVKARMKLRRESALSAGHRFECDGVEPMALSEASEMRKPKEVSEEELAATRIQSSFRGHSVRRAWKQAGAAAGAVQATMTKTEPTIVNDEFDAWRGERGRMMYFNQMTSLEFDFDSKEFLDGLRAQGVELHEEGVEMQGKIDVQLTTQDMNSVMLTAGQRRTKKARPKAGFPFDIDVCIHAFPPPSPPQNLQLISHNNLSVRVAWDSPASWGGCALSHFELQMRKVTVKGDLKEWIPGEWRSGLEGCIFENVHEAHVRVRAFNLGTLVPSAWSETFHVRTEKEIAKLQSGRKLSQAESEKKALTRSDRRRTADLDGDSHAEQGVAVVMTSELADYYLKPHVDHSPAHSWTDFEKRVGKMFMEAGVYGGAAGRIFDMTPRQVLDLVEGTPDNKGLSKDKPLMSLAIAATWVLQTLAHHSAEPDQWIYYINEIGSLVDLISPIPEDETNKGMLKELIFSLIRVYESMRQCEESGCITQHVIMEHNKSNKKGLKNEWADQMVHVKNEVATHVMAVVLCDRFRQWGAANSSQAALVKQLSEGGRSV